MELFSVQVVLFIKDKFTGKYTDLASQLQDQFENTPPTQLPIPPEAPDEIPRLIFHFKDFNLEISNIKIQIILKPQKVRDEEIINTEKLPEIISKILDTPIVKTKFEIIRIGFISKFFTIKAHSALTNLLNPSLIQNDKFEEIEVKINKIKTIENYSCNNIEHVFQGEKKKNNVVTPGLVLVKDLNTAQSNTVSIQPIEINKLITKFLLESAESKLLKII
ncbi:hypothetical protein GW756_05935 [bacterium]|nr:hypothetical protein [bacterium]NCQ55960.1 hypothetical protein [Candidatus Parcubacteria bacterium]NCS67985.1 hypothetical protein [Candidatus Peregrinibacteria bacterium]NCS96879.1 hypothetical protein [bacterium]